MREPNLKMSDRVSILAAIYLTCLGLTWCGSANPSLALVPSSTLAQAQSDPPSSPPPSITPGDSGKEVRVLQDFLKGLGHFEGPLDGEYGPATETAISEFQTSQGLEPTGTLDAQTWEQLKAAYQETQKPEGDEKEAEKEKKPPKKKPRFSRERLILLLGGFVTLGIGGGGLFMLLRAFSKAMPAPPPLAVNKVEEEEVEVEEELELPTAAIASPIPDPFLELPERDLLAEPPPETIENNVEPEVNSLLPHPETQPEKPAPKNGKERQKSKAKERAKIEQNHNKSLAAKPSPSLPKLDLIEELIKDLQKPQPEVRRKAIWELAQRADSRAIQPLIGLLIDSDSQQRSLILEALAQIGTRTLKPMNRALTIALQDENAQVRKNAIRDLTQVYETISKLSRLLYLAADDPDTEVQETARWALDRLNSLQLNTLSEESENRHPPS
ncbi:MAG: peptidoglycan-binding protein [Cyanobacteriota bacterium]|nr:peptidoglycan-binding protein [Cyanobacteriota bacterium]